MLPDDFLTAVDATFCSCLKKDEDFVIDDKKFHWCKKFGSMLHFYGKRDSYFPFQAVVGPDWPVVVLVYFLIIFINIVVLYYISALGAAVIAIGVCGFVVVLCSYSFVACSNPGVVFQAPPINLDDKISHDVEARHPSSPSEDQKPLNGLVAVPNSIECGHCKGQRPFTARHCSYCKHCIDKLDHHCPWCGKCIGGDTIAAFNIFIYSLCFQVYFLIGSAIYYGVTVIMRSASN